MDKIPGLTIKTAALNALDIWKIAFSACVRKGIFPSHWKVQKLVLLPNGKKPTDELSSYRPLCLLDIADKLFERIIHARLEAAIQQARDLSENDFRKGRSTIDAIDRWWRRY